MVTSFRASDPEHVVGDAESAYGTGQALHKTVLASPLEAGGIHSGVIIPPSRLNGSSGASDPEHVVGDAESADYINQSPHKNFLELTDSQWFYHPPSRRNGSFGASDPEHIVRKEG
ncbi:hypothetical protein C8R44DRAFT_746319 [Mycena epipterygia]|nr:hypothetical protein C8R44DRAFT_746319 [Mycena epipterygia]